AAAARTGNRGSATRGRGGYRGNGRPGRLLPRRSARRWEHPGRGRVPRASRLPRTAVAGDVTLRPSGRPVQALEPGGRRVQARRAEVPVLAPAAIKDKEPDSGRGILLEQVADRTRLPADLAILAPA